MEQCIKRVKKTPTHVIVSFVTDYPDPFRSTGFHLRLFSSSGSFGRLPFIRTNWNWKYLQAL